jgi:hypothetical protein
MLNAENELHQLEQLELYLDGEMDAVASAALKARLASDAALSAELKELKSQRALRAAVWQSMEGDTAAAGRLMWRVRGVMNAPLSTPVQFPVTGTIAPKRRLWSQWNLARIGSAAAACVVLGFFAGRFNHNAGPNLLSTPASTVSPVGDSARDSSGNTIAKLNNPTDDVKPADKIYSVPFTNEYGQPVTEMHFATQAEANNFAHDVDATHHTAPAMSGPPKLATEERPAQVPF